MGKLLGQATAIAALFIVSFLNPAYASSAPDRKLSFLSPTAAGKFFQNFKENCFDEPFDFEFNIKNVSKNSDETSYRGTLCFDPTLDKQFLVNIFCSNSDKQYKTSNFSNKIDSATMWNPIAEPILFTPADIGMPFVMQKNVEYYGNKRILGRPAQIFKIALDKNDYQRFEYVKIAIDQDFLILLSVDFCVGNKLLRQLKVNGFKKIEGKWSIESIDVLDIKTREKSRLTFGASNEKIQ